MVSQHYSIIFVTIFYKRRDNLENIRYFQFFNYIFDTIEFFTIRNSARSGKSAFVGIKYLSK